MPRMKKYAYIDKLENGKWRVRVPVRDADGKQILRQPEGTKPFDSLAEAKAFASEAGRLMRHQKRAEAGEGYSVREIAASLVHERLIKRPKAGARIQSLFLAHIKNDPIGDIDVNALKTSDVKAFRDRLMERKATQVKRVRNAETKAYELKHVECDRTIATQTRRNVLTLLRVVFKYAKSEGKCSQENPFKDLIAEDEGTTEVKRSTALKENELHKLIEAIDGPEKWMIAFCAYQGLRAGELVSLHWRDVHMDAPQPYMVVRYGGTPIVIKGESVWPPTKGGKPREIPLLPLAIEALKNWKRESEGWWQGDGQWAAQGLVFPSRRGGRRNALHLFRQEAWNAIKKRSGLSPKLRFHDLRHTCATSLLNGYWGEKWSLQGVQHFLGHAELKTTENYLHQDKGGMAASAQKTTGRVRSKKVGQEGTKPFATEAFSLTETSTALEGADFGSVAKTFQKLTISEFEALAKLLKSLAPPAGVEPATRGLGTRFVTQGSQSLSSDSGSKFFPRFFHAISGLKPIAETLADETKKRSPGTAALATGLASSTLVVCSVDEASGDPHPLVAELVAKAKEVQASDAVYVVMAGLALAEAIIAAASLVTLGAGTESQAVGT